MTDSVRKSLSRIPGWEDAHYEEMQGGLNNRCWLVDNGQARAVLKIDEGVRGEPFTSRREEARIQGRAAEAELANAVIYATDRIYMTEFMDGRVWSPACLDDDGNLEALAGALKRLHGLPLTGRVFDARQAARIYADHIAAKHAGRVRDCLRILDAMPLPDTLNCCHNDLVAANIIATPDLRFLDWEYACDNDPVFDLATIVAHHELSSGRADCLLNAYFDGEGSRWRERLERQAESYDALRWLWQTARSPAIS